MIRRVFEIQKAWHEFKKKNDDSSNSSEWKVALESIMLPQITLDDWFDLFFSDNACYSLQKYQTKEIGDTNVQFTLWKQKKNTNTSSSGSSGNNDDANDENKENYIKTTTSTSTMIPKLERKLTYMHPLSGNMMGPSEAETFRLQTLKRYGKYGAILTNTTTVGKSVPMGDCFRVEDQWVIEQSSQSQSPQSKKNDSNDDTHASYYSLTLSVKFRSVFVKRTMFKSMITKNVISETNKWFIGYEKMMKVALQSKEHIHNIQKRQCRRLAVSANSNSNIATQSNSDTRRRLPLPPFSADTVNSPSSVSVSQQASISSPGDDDLSNSRMTTTSSLLLDEKQFLTANEEKGNHMNAANASFVDSFNTKDDNDTVKVSNPQVKKEKDVTKTTLLSRVSVVLLDSLGSFFQALINTIRSLPSFFLLILSRGDGDIDYSVLTMPVVILSILLFTILFLFLLQMNISMHTSIVSIEKQLQDVHTQNTILLKRINELSSSSSS